MLDLVFSKNELEIESINYHAPIGKSDHASLAFDFTLEGSVDQVDEVTGRKKYFKADYTKIKHELCMINWEAEMLEENTVNSWDTFLHNYNQVVLISPR